MCNSCLQRYAARGTSFVNSKAGLRKVLRDRENKVTEGVEPVQKLSTEVKEALAKKRRSGYVIPSARIRENSKVNDDG